MASAEREAITGVWGQHYSPGGSTLNCVVFSIADNWDEAVGLCTAWFF